MIKIALAQINTTVGNLKANRYKIQEYILKAKESRADVIVFPELTITGYPPEDLLHKDHFIQDNIKELRELVKFTSGITAVVGFVDRDKKKKDLIYNAAAILQSKKWTATYHKQALPNYGVFDEKRYFSSGKDPLIVDVDGCRVGINICEDIWEEDVCQKVCAGGAKIILNLSSSPYDVGKLNIREQIVKRVAAKHKVSVAYVNAVGGQDELVFDGCSLVANRKGEIIASGLEFEEDMIIANIETNPRKKVTTVRSIADRSNINERIYKALVLGTRDYVAKNGFKKVVMGLSGGIDSALVAAIAVDALGSDNVIGVTMPSKYNSKGTQKDAKRLAENLGISLLEFPIQGVMESYTELLSGAFSGLSTDLAEENIQARIRGNILMALSNKFGWLVLTTGNKSELAVGYCTLYGDMSGGFAVIKDLPKTKVYGLSRMRNEIKPSLCLGPEIPKRNKFRIIPRTVIVRAPSAELRTRQKDQDSLPPYDVLDAILKCYVEEHQSLKKMKSQFPEDIIKDVIALVDRNEYKRRQAPPGVKITPRAFGRDWRLPITSKYKES